MDKLQKSLLVGMKSFFSFFRLLDESLPVYLIIVGATVSAITYPLQVLSNDFKVLYGLSASLSLIGLLLKSIREKRVFLHLPMLSATLLLAVVGVSLFQVEGSQYLPLYQYIGYLIRMLPFIVFFYFYRFLGLGISFFLKLALVLCCIGALVMAYGYSVDLMGPRILRLNTENTIGGMLVSLIPLLLLEKRYSLVVISSVMIICGDGRMVQLVLAIILTAWVVNEYISKEKLAYLFALVIVGVPIVLVVAKTNTLFPSGFIFYPAQEWVRTAMSLVTNNAITSHPFTGIGFGGVCKETYDAVGRCIIPHGSHAFFWAQSGMFAYALFLVLSVASIFRPLSLFTRNDCSFCFAIALVNLAGFLIFLTRPHYDSTVYNLFWLLGISLTYVYLPKKAVADSQGG